MLQLLQPLQPLQEGLPQLLQPGHLALDNFAAPHSKLDSRPPLCPGQALEPWLQYQATHLHLMRILMTPAWLSSSSSLPTTSASSQPQNLSGHLPGSGLAFSSGPFLRFPQSCESLSCVLESGPRANFSPLLTGPARHTGPGAVTDSFWSMERVPPQRLQSPYFFLVAP